MKFIDFLPVSKRNRRPNSREIYTNPKIIQPTERIDSSPGFKFHPKNWMLALLLIVFLAGYLFFFKSRFFNIKHLEISGDPKPETTEIIKQLEGKNIFLFGSSRIKKILKEKQPAIKTINVIIGFPDTVRINLVERDAALIWQTNSKRYLVDREGVVFKETQKDDLPIVIDEKNAIFDSGQKILSTDFVEIIRILSVKIPAIVNEPVRDFSIGDSLFCMTVNTLTKKIIFYTQVPLNSQLLVLQKLMEAKKDDIKEYIDLRVEGYAYYK